MSWAEELLGKIQTRSEGEHGNTERGKKGGYREGQVSLPCFTAADCQAVGLGFGAAAPRKRSRVSIMAQPREQGATYLIIRLQVHMCKLQQLPKLRGLVVVEHGLLKGGEEVGVSQTLPPDGGGAKWLGSGSSHRFSALQVMKKSRLLGVPGLRRILRALLERVP